MLNRNSLNAYAPSAAPSATAAICDSEIAGSAKVAELTPPSERAALPAALRSISGLYFFSALPRPVK